MSRQPPSAQPYVLDIAPYKGGEAVLPGFAHPIKLASNENPLGTSPKAKAAFLGAADNLWLYPEGTAKKLREAIAKRYGLEADRIICGAGSDEIFTMLIRAYIAPGDEIVQNQHAFSIYRIFGQAAGAVIRSGADDANLNAQVDTLLAEMSDRTKLVFLANPNNPTGGYLPFDEVRRLHAGMPPQALLVLDGAYAEFVQRNDYAAGIELAAENNNVIMTRTFSKIYGLAALRLGWAYAAPNIIDALNRVRSPFNMPTPALLAGVAAMEDTAFLEASVAHNAGELARVDAALKGMGLKVTPSVANFVLAHFTPAKTAPAADAFLRSRGIIVRRMESYGLPETLRISIGSTDQNDALLSALKDFMA
jgi:histidinol-phosphate aminotransferase